MQRLPEGVEVFFEELLAALGQIMERPRVASRSRPQTRYGEVAAVGRAKPAIELDDSLNR